MAGVYIRAALAEGVREAGLSIARKNGLVAALVLAYLAGPLNAEQWRGLVVSLNGHLAKELSERGEAGAERAAPRPRGRAGRALRLRSAWPTPTPRRERLAGRTLDSRLGRNDGTT